MEEVNIGEWIGEGANLFKENLSVLALAGVITVLLSTVSFGILAGPMIAGLSLICLRLHDKSEPAPTAGEVFQGFGFFLNSFLLFLVWGLASFVASLILSFIPILGQLASLAISLGVPALLMFAVFLIVEQDKPFWPASMESIEKVRENLWPLIGLGVIAGLIGGIGAMVCYVGLFFTVPLQVCILTVAYRKVYGGGPTLEAADPAERFGFDQPAEPAPTPEPGPADVPDEEV